MANKNIDNFIDLMCDVCSVSLDEESKRMNIEHDDITMIRLMTHKVLFRKYIETHPSIRLHSIKENTPVLCLSLLSTTSDGEDTQPRPNSGDKINGKISNTVLSSSRIQDKDLF